MPAVEATQTQATMSYQSQQQPIMSYVGAPGGVAPGGYTMSAMDPASQAGTAQGMADPALLVHGQPQGPGMGLSVQQQQQMGVQSFALPQPQLPQAMSYVASAQQ